MLLGGLGRFVPCSIGANHCRLRMLVGRGVVMGFLLGFGECLWSFLGSALAFIPISS